MTPERVPPSTGYTGSLSPSVGAATSNALTTPDGRAK